MIQPFQKGKAKSAMMWAAFCGTERSDLVRMVRDPEAKANGYTAASYIDVLEADPYNLPAWHVVHAGSCSYTLS